MTLPATNLAATVRDVTMRFREHTALDGVSTVIVRDAITGLLGRNGAGKTRLMQLLTGHRVPTGGSIEVFGARPYENDSVLRRICFIKEGQRYPDNFRVRDALDSAALLFPEWDVDLAASLTADFDLPPKRPIKKLSRGMNSAVGIIIGLASRAPVTLFDEPYLGSGRRRAAALLRPAPRRPRRAPADPGAPMLASIFVGFGIGVVYKRWGSTGIWGLTLTSILALGGLGVLLTWWRAWDDLGTWLSDQSVGPPAVGPPWRSPPRWHHPRSRGSVPSSPDARPDDSGPCFVT
jgi:ABC-type lipoprotein export system ATPase subunit